MSPALRRCLILCHLANMQYCKNAGLHLCTCSRRLRRFERLPTPNSILDPSRSLKFQSTIRFHGWSATTPADYDHNAYMVKFEGNGKDRLSRERSADMAAGLLGRRRRGIRLEWQACVSSHDGTAPQWSMANWAFYCGAMSAARPAGGKRDKWEPSEDELVHERGCGGILV
jgi:hypothetical protein